jgi:hypothetical protein
MALILKRAPIGWDQGDYEVLENGVIVGRIFFLEECGPPAVTAPLPMPASSLESCGHGAMLALEHVVGKSVFITAGGRFGRNRRVSNSIQTRTRDRISLTDTGRPPSRPPT